MEIFNLIAGLCSIAGLLFAIVVYISLGKLRERIEREEKDFIKRRAQIREKLAKLNEILYSCEVVDESFKSALRQEIYFIQQKFPDVLERIIKRKLKEVLARADKNDIENLRKTIDYIIARFT